MHECHGYMHGIKSYGVGLHMHGEDATHNAAKMAIGNIQGTINSVLV